MNRSPTIACSSSVSSLCVQIVSKCITIVITMWKYNHGSTVSINQPEISNLHSINSDSCMIDKINIKATKVLIKYKVKVTLNIIPDVRKLNQIRDRIIRAVEDYFNAQEQKLRSVIRSQYKIDPPNTTKLRMAI